MAPLWILLTLLPILGGAQRFICKGRILGAYYADAKSGCKAFHVCVRVAGGGVRDFRFFCPPGTLFHQEAQTCTDWGDDDPLACPADIYDGQFDLYKLGSVYDTKKLSSTANREEESEFGLQRAETGDRRLSQNNNNAANDLRAAHSSDFFSGQRDRGRDEAVASSLAPTSPPARPAQPRQSFRRPTTPRPLPTTTQFITVPTFPSVQPSSTSQYEISKRKLIRKRPVYHSTQAPTTFLQNNSPQTSFKEQSQNQQSYKEQPQNSQFFKEQNTPQRSFKEQTQPQQSFKEQTQRQQSFKEQQFALKEQPQQFQQQNFNRRPQLQARPIPTTTPDVPPQYKEFKEEYVEVSRVTPKPKPNRYYPNNPTPLPSSHATSASQYNKKDGLIELYNYDAQSTPGLNVQQNSNNNPFKVKNGYSISDVFAGEDFARTRNQNNNLNNNGKQAPTTTIDYNAATRPAPTTQSYKSYNSVPYETEKNSIIPFSKQTYYNNPTTTPSTTTTFYTTVRPELPQNLNTVAYNTNIGFHSQSNFADPEDDDGQYRPPQGEEDGQYRPELYEKELLSGAHSLNIAASGNRLPEDQKPYSKTQPPPKYSSQTAAPRPFRPTPAPTQTTRSPEYTTTVAPQTQRTFDLFQTYTTTSRPTSDFPGSQDFVPINNGPPRLTTTVSPRAPETRAPRPKKPAPAPTPTSPRPVNNKEDSSYDYAYYDSDPGFSEYDHIEEFGRTKKRA